MLICNTNIKVDSSHKFCLNDLHVASGGAPRHRPSLWLENRSTQTLIDALGRDNAISVTQGRNGGTYVCKQLVYAYAMWLSPEFHIRVVDAYDALANGRVEEALAIAQRKRDRDNARLESSDLNEMVKLGREEQGKTVASYHYSNEYDMINRIVLGETSKKFRERHEMSDSELIRDHVSALEIKAIQHLQKSNTTLIELGMPYDARKAHLTGIFNKRYNQALIEQVTRLEA